jgi:hypothetical protein
MLGYHTFTYIVLILDEIFKYKYKLTRRNTVIAEDKKTEVLRIIPTSNGESRYIIKFIKNPLLVPIPGKLLWVLIVNGLLKPR